MFNGGSPAVIAVILLVMAAPIAWSYFARGRSSNSPDIEAFLTNRGHNGFVATLAGAIAGNIGIGSFLALFLFANQAPVLAFSIVGAYTLGLLLCAAFARTIRNRAQDIGSVGLIDLIGLTHGAKQLMPIWVGMAVVFVLRSAVQLGALGFIAASAFGGSAPLAIIGCAIFIASYLVIGGYRAAVHTDILQAVVIVVGCAVCAFGLTKLNGTPEPFFSFGEYRPAILIGIWLFIPWSAVLAVDNWQRITLAKSTSVATTGYVCAAFICGGLLLLMAMVGYRAPQGADMYASFAMIVPDGMVWIASAVFIACIMSSIDTFIIPLVSAMGTDNSLGRVRWMIIALVTVTAVTALLFSNILDTIIAAFNSLAVFLPVAFGALFLKRPSAQAAIGSIYAGLATAIVFSFVAQSMASIIGFLVALCAYAFLHNLGRRSVAA